MFVTDIRKAYHAQSRVTNPRGRENYICPRVFTNIIRTVVGILFLIPPLKKYHLRCKVLHCYK
jgi:hypothetical protein